MLARVVSFFAVMPVFVDYARDIAILLTAVVEYYALNACMRVCFYGWLYPMNVIRLNIYSIIH